MARGLTLRSRAILVNLARRIRYYRSDAGSFSIEFQRSGTHSHSDFFASPAYVRLENRWLGVCNTSQMR
jgi:hypothetical protein